MDVNPQQYEPQTREPGERQAQFGQASQADVPLTQTPHDASMANIGQVFGPRNVMPGTDVYGSDGKKVGSVQQAFEESFLVRKGMLFVHDYYIPYAYVARASLDRIDLSLTSEDARNQDWAQRPGVGAGGALASPRLASDEYGVYGPGGARDTIQGATESDNTLVANPGSEPSGGNLGGPAMGLPGLTPMPGMGVPPGTGPGAEPTTGGEILTGSGMSGAPDGTDRDLSTTTGAGPHTDVMSGAGGTTSTDVLAGTDNPRRTDIVSDDPTQTGDTTGARR